ncbi:type II toxin-antitoxin system HicB family antitoxin [Elstera sp.]|jgi:antitoxin HicB|uniref:type II toxin-antitoxin system HicB family antitoxin n=1 Tax=Elstera sp. TaxID=1916664 RepID=UPI0037C07F8A
MQPMTLLYPAIVAPDEGGRFLVKFPDLPEALTDGATRAEALAEAADCLSEALASRIIDGETIPLPSAATDGMVPVAPDQTIALKAALYDALHRQGLRVADLARRLGIDHKDARRLLDPKHRTKMPALVAALNVLGSEVAVTIRTIEAAAE